MNGCKNGCLDEFTAKINTNYKEVYYDIYFNDSEPDILPSLTYYVDRWYFNIYTNYGCEIDNKIAHHCPFCSSDLQAPEI